MRCVRVAFFSSRVPVKFASCPAMLLEITILVLALAVAGLTRLLFAEQSSKKCKHPPRSTSDGESPVPIFETTVFICKTSKGSYHFQGCHRLKDYFKNAQRYDVCSECDKSAETTIFILKTSKARYHYSGCKGIKNNLKSAKKYELCSDCDRLRSKSK